MKQREKGEFTACASRNSFKKLILSNNLANIKNVCKHFPNLIQAFFIKKLQGGESLNRGVYFSKSVTFVAGTSNQNCSICAFFRLRQFLTQNFCQNEIYAFLTRNSWRSDNFDQKWSTRQKFRVRSAQISF